MVELEYISEYVYSVYSSPYMHTERETDAYINTCIHTDRQTGKQTGRHIGKGGLKIFQKRGHPRMGNYLKREDKYLLQTLINIFLKTFHNNKIMSFIKNRLHEYYYISYI